MPPTLVLPPRFTPDSIAVGRAALEQGWDVVRLTSWRPDAALAGVEVVLYGEPLFVAAVAEMLDRVVLEPPFDWLANIPARWRRREVEFTTMDAVRASLTSPRFVKPADEKCFVAAVYDEAGALPGAHLVAGSTPVLVAEPVHWSTEFRCFACDGAVVSCSVYLRDGVLADDGSGTFPATREEIDAAAGFAGEVLADVAVPPGVVLDVGWIAGRGWAVVEVNPAFGSGIYACDPHAVLATVARACRRPSDVADHERAWCIERA